MDATKKKKGLINACAAKGEKAKVRRTGGVWSGAGTLADRATAAPSQHRSRGAGLGPPLHIILADHCSHPSPLAPCQLMVMPPDTPGTTGLL